MQHKRLLKNDQDDTLTLKARQKLVAIKWQTPTSTWLEDTQNGHFVLAEKHGLGAIEWQGRASTRLTDVAQLIGAALPKNCQCAPIFPEDFQFCPHCGQALQLFPAIPSHVHPASAWWGPRHDRQLPQHVPHGLPVSSIAIASAIENHPAEPVIGQAERRMLSPPNPHAMFAAAHFGFAHERLIALAYLRNVLQYWEPNAGRWHLLNSEKNTADITFSTSNYAWLPAASASAGLGEVGIIPTEQGLMRLWINPINASYRTETVLRAKLVSAPGELDKHIACLFELDGSMRLWCAFSNGEQPRLIKLASEKMPMADWSAPLAYDRRMMWLHEEGQFIWQPHTDEAQWLAWPTGWTPRLQLSGPTQSRDGRLWQLGHNGEQYCFLELGKSEGEMHAIDGARLGFAGLLFRRGHRVLDQPWEAETVEDPQGDDFWIWPVLRHYDHQRTKAAGLVLRFSGQESAESTLQAKNVDVQVRWSGQRDVILAHIPRLSRPIDSVAIIYDDCLWLHNPQMDHMLGWHLHNGSSA